MALLLALPAEAHTPAEQAVWEREWVERVQARGGPTERLIRQFVDFQIRHAPPPPQVLASSTYRGIGSNVEQWRALVTAYFPNEVNRALCIVDAESGGNPNARNPSSGAAGLFQVMPFWWDKYGGDRYDPETNVRIAAKIRAQQGWGAWSPYLRGECR